MNYLELWLEGFLEGKESLDKEDIEIIRKKISAGKVANNPPLTWPNTPYPRPPFIYTSSEQKS